MTRLFCQSIQLVILVATLLSLGCSRSNENKLLPPLPSEDSKQASRVKKKETNPTALLDRAVEALGGVENINKTRVGSSTSVTTRDFDLVEGGSKIEIVQYFDSPSRLRRNVSVITPVKGKTTFLVKDGICWQRQEGGEWQSEPLRNGQQANTFPWSVFSSFLTLKSCPKNQLSVTENKSLMGAKSYYIRRVVDGKWYGTVEIDAETFLMRSISNPVYISANSFVKNKADYSNFKTIDGAKIPFKVTSFRDGQLAQVLELTEISIGKRPEESVFERD